MQTLTEECVEDATQSDTDTDTDTTDSEWSGFNQLLKSEVPPKATIGYIPVITCLWDDLYALMYLLQNNVPAVVGQEKPSYRVCVFVIAHV